ncbi:phosphatase inhibitor-domain-containing protein [Thermoascus aurantiacus ATCC 26904]
MSTARQATPNLTSSTQVETASESPQGSSSIRVSGTLRLRGEPFSDAAQVEERTGSTRRIRWSEDVVDNEGMGKKSSKVCCIYHKSRPVGESSSESESSDSSSSETDSDSDIDHGEARMSRSRQQVEGREHCDQDVCEHVMKEHSFPRSSRQRKEKTKRRKPSPNAYERIPKTAKRHSGT